MGFANRINDLLSLAVLTDDQRNLLSDLQDYYEIALEYLAQISLVYGGGMTISDLSHIAWVTGTRAGRQEIADLALLQVGQVGGQPYWSYMGFANRVEWCDTFVYWVYHFSGNASLYPTHGYTAPNVNAAWTVALVNHFRAAGQWENNSFRNLAAGDVIFFDWDLDGRPNHVGIVIGRDANMVYFVDGNAGDQVRLQARMLDSAVILGYAILF